MSIDNIISPASRPCSEEHSTCEACGNPFDCGATLAGCWCTQVKLSEQSLTTLRARYKACLCRPCLESFTEAEQRKEEAISENGPLSQGAAATRDVERMASIDSVLDLS